jgi:predicted nucleotidyltransferase
MSELGDRCGTVSAGGDDVPLYEVTDEGLRRRPEPVGPRQPRFEAFAPISTRLSLDEVLARMAEREDVVGLVFLGTTATGQLGPASDYDLLVVTPDGPEFDVEFTYIDHRPTDVLFVALPMIRRLALGEFIPPGRERDVARWLATGKVALDRTGELTPACAGLGRQHDPSSSDEPVLFSRWAQANFNLVTNRRYHAEGDRIYQRALDMRLLYGLFETVMDCLRFRGIPWQGEKAAVRWLDEHDPAFLALFEAALAAVTTADRMALYEELVRKACEPVGEVWGAEQTGGASYPQGDPRASSRWEKLFE